ncbi:Uncharacterized protein FWK35_00037748 [Aphis craccivora]|uniref:Uncharacterized protein n=1 Tax=Aphis craccivora TaxID=307492 RepID=A0A6G0YVM7_APHCR|nr:Uncharacterized protein FWK35_00037748 [Aphis craccivora]
MTKYPIKILTFIKKKVITQCLWRKLLSCQSKNRYFTNVIFSHEIKKISALYFSPVNNIISVFKELINSNYYVENERDLQTVVDYFEDM